jgi:hypothetical protein
MPASCSLIADTICVSASLDFLIIDSLNLSRLLYFMTAEYWVRLDNARPSQNPKTLAAKSNNHGDIRLHLYRRHMANRCGSVSNNTKHCRLSLEKVVTLATLNCGLCPKVKKPRKNS